ncbi:hypothetical protein ACHAXA_003821 [Cyclostephanos tholiformis]|uniref:Uncharacterized protein n=1 Tax=Cyclostephanos tholiformis TaxID=382380 RepID=A0ABD3RWN5_9STRA
MTTTRTSNDDGGGEDPAASSRRGRLMMRMTTCTSRMSDGAWNNRRGRHPSSVLGLILLRLSTAVAVISTTIIVANVDALVRPMSARSTSGVFGSPPNPSSSRRRRGRLASSIAWNAVDILDIRGGGGNDDDNDDDNFEGDDDDIHDVSTNDDDTSPSSPSRVLTRTRKKRNDREEEKKRGGVKFPDGGGGDATSLESGEGKKKKDANDDVVDDARHAIDDAMRGRDAASALGDAIRDRAEILRRDDVHVWASAPRRSRRAPSSSSSSSSSRYYVMDEALESIGLSMGTAGTDVSDLLADYFLKTHGGTHVAQTLLSLLASILGVACLSLPPFPSSSSSSSSSAYHRRSNNANTDASHLSRHILLSALKCRLMQQAMIVAMAKHASGMIGAMNVGASLIPLTGVRNARRKLESIASDPVGQYLFYCSLLAVWMGWFGGGGDVDGMGGYLARLRGTVVSIMNSATTAPPDGAAAMTATATSQLLDALSRQPPPWYMCRSPCGAGIIVPFLVLGPVLLREVVSVIWVCSDVLELLSSSSSGGGGMTGAILSTALSTSRSAIDAFMGLLIAHEEWRDADSFQRQRALSSLVSRCSLLTELAVGGILIADAAQSFWTYALVGPTMAGTLMGGGVGVGGGGRSRLGRVVGKTACAHLYVNFLLSRRRKIAKVLSEVVHP